MFRAMSRGNKVRWSFSSINVKIFTADVVSVFQHGNCGMVGRMLLLSVYIPR